jgi:general secretion pathway protein D
MKKTSRITPDFLAVRRSVAGVLLSCASVAVLAPAPALAQESGAAALNFVGADIESVIKAVGHYTGMTFIIDPRVKGTLTLVSERPLTKAQAFGLLTSALRLQGYAVVTGDGYAKVVPEAEAKLQSSPTAVGIRGPRVHGDQIATQVIRLNYESAANLTAVLRPLISPNNAISANPSNNSLVITDYADNLARLAKIIAALDTPVGAPYEVVPIRYAIASDIAAIVQRLMEPTPAGDSGRVTVLADPRTNSVIIRAPTAARANLAKSLIARIDQPTSVAGNINVVYLKNADATKLAQTLRAVVAQDTSALQQAPQGTAGGSVQPGTQGGGGLPPGQQGQQPSQATFGGAGNTFAQQDRQAAAAPQGSGFIQADASTNTLIITAPEAIYRNLRAVIDQLDVRRAQVYIESLIIEVNAAKASEFGVQWLAASGNSGSQYRVGGLQSFGNASDNIIGLARGTTTPTPGFSVGLFKMINGQLGLGAVAKFLETDGNANILSTPNLITLDNELATIKVGQNVPIISGQFTTPASGTATNPFQTIDRRDVGLTLKVRPQISEGGTIKMAIYHETSSVDPSTLNAPAGVTTNIRVIENNVVADDGQIIVLGGLISDTEGDSEERVRGLADIPILGNLFKYRKRNRGKTNLMIFLRPVVVRSKDASSNLTADRYDYMRATGIAAQPTDNSILLRNLGAPVLPPLIDGQPAPGGVMATVPAPAAPATNQPAAPTGQYRPAPPPTR